MRTIAIVNQKGGCGKTTTAINVAAVYARRGCRTLLVDMDPQSHCAAGLGVPESRIDPGIGEALLRADESSFEPEGLFWEAARHLDLAPSTTRLAALEAPGGGLHEMPDRDRRLDLLLRRVSHRYDICLIDCPPTIGLLTFNALRAAREALIPVETGFFSLRGAEKQWKTIQRTIDRLGRPMACHLLPTLHNPASRNAREILSALQRQYPTQLVPAIIREHESLREAASYGQPIVEYAPHSPAHHDFEALVDWLQERADRPDLMIELLPSGDSRREMAPQDLMPAQSVMTDREASDDRDPVRRDATAADRRGGGDGGGSMSSRAAELVQRVRENSRRAAAARHPQTVANEPPTTDAGSAAQADVDKVADVDRSAPSIASAAPIRLERSNVNRGAATQLSHLFGVRQTSRGVLFVQPGDETRTIHVAGDFNQWSPITHRLRFNSETGVYQTLVELPPGRYQYRLIIDGQWQPDPYNPTQETNTFGVSNSVFVVEAAPAVGEDR